MYTSFLSPVQVLSGVTQISFLKTLSENDNQNRIASYLKDIAQHVLNKNSLKYFHLVIAIGDYQSIYDECNCR